MIGLIGWCQLDLSMSRNTSLQCLQHQALEGNQEQQQQPVVLERQLWDPTDQQLKKRTPYTWHWTFFIGSPIKL